MTEQKPVYHPWLTRFFYTDDARQRFIDSMAGAFDTYPSYQPLAHRKYKLEFTLKTEFREQYKYEHHPIEARQIKKN